LVENFASAAANAGFKPRQLAVADCDGAFIFRLRETKNGPPRLEHLPRKKLAVRKVDQRMHVSNAAFGEEIGFLRVSRFHGLRCHRSRGTGVVSPGVDERGHQHVEHGEENRLQRLARVLVEDQVMDVRDGDF
jgi:hypothetical protein